MKHDPADYISAEECAKRMGYKYEYFRDKVSKSPKFPTPIGKNYYWPDVHWYMQNSRKKRAG